MTVIDEFQEEDAPELGISTEKVRMVILKARQFDAKEDDADPDEGSNAADDGMADVLEDKPEDDAVRRELIAYINELNEDEQVALVALAWLGRGTFDLDEWDEATPDRARRTQQTHGRNIFSACRCSAITSPTGWKPSARNTTTRRTKSWKRKCPAKRTIRRRWSRFG